MKNTKVGVRKAERATEEFIGLRAGPLLGVALASTLSACGGGGEASDTSAVSADSMAQAYQRKIKPAPAPAPAPAPDGWQTIATEGQSFTATGTVRYGADIYWVQMEINGSATCSNSFFGTDPIPGVVKSCQISTTSSSTTTSDTSTTISANCGLSNFSSEALQRLNAYRSKGATCGGYGYFSPTTALVWDSRLISAATTHALDMAKNNLTSHIGSDGSDGGQRMINAGYDWSSWGENIGWGFGSVQSMIDWWIASPVHCANIMNPRFKDVGLACVKGTASDTYSSYWTMDLGAPR